MVFLSLLVLYLLFHLLLFSGILPKNESLQSLSVSSHLLLLHFQCVLEFSFFPLVVIVYLLETSCWNHLCTSLFLLSFHSVLSFLPSLFLCEGYLWFSSFLFLGLIYFICGGFYVKFNLFALLTDLSQFYFDSIHFKSFLPRTTSAICVHASVIFLSNFTRILTFFPFQSFLYYLLISCWSSS